MARIEVSGVRSSCVTVDMKSSLSRSSSWSRVLAARSSAVAACSSFDFCSSSPAVGAHLRGLVEDVHHLLEAGRLLLHHRRHHHPGGGAPDGPGQLGLGELDQVPASAGSASRPRGPRRRA